MSALQHRHDFGPSICLRECAVCGKYVLNRGCSQCLAKFCEPCYSEHSCANEIGIQTRSGRQDVISNDAPQDSLIQTRSGTQDVISNDAPQDSLKEAQEQKPDEAVVLAESTILEEEAVTEAKTCVDDVKGEIEDDEKSKVEANVEEEGEPYPEIVYGAPMSERLSGDKMEKKMKKIIKEGGKRGVEIEGAADMGGLQFFCTTMQEPNGDVDFLYESLKAMNAKSDANEEERKGGSGRVGKMLVSPAQDNTKVALVAYCPPAKQGVLKADQWMKDMVGALGGGEILFSDATTAKVEIKNDADKGLFVLKLKDSAITESINYLKSKGLFPDSKDDDDSDYVFGDDDFPTVENEEAAKEEAGNAEEEESADFGDDPLAMLGGMGEEEVYKVTLMDEHVAAVDGEDQAKDSSKEVEGEKASEEIASKESEIIETAVATQVETSPAASPDEKSQEGGNATNKKNKQRKRRQ